MGWQQVLQLLVQASNLLLLVCYMLLQASNLLFLTGGQRPLLSQLPGQGG
jgi:hypothetical protein